jgi:hypothetical protein
METICRYCGNTDAPECCSAKVFLKRAEAAEQRVKELLATIEVLQEALRREGAARTAEDTDGKA